MDLAGDALALLVNKELEWMAHRCAGGLDGGASTLELEFGFGVGFGFGFGFSAGGVDEWQGPWACPRLPSQ